LDPEANLIAEQSYNALATKHNQTITLRFPPQTAAAGKQYTLQLSGTAGNQLSVWGYSLAPQDQTVLSYAGVESRAQVLYYVGKYQLNGATAVGMVARDTGRYGLLVLLLLLIIFLPGLLIAEFIHGENWDVLSYWGIAFTSGLASWPILWLWMTLLGGRFTGWLLWLLFIVGWGWWMWRQWQNGFQWIRMSPLRLMAFLLLLLITYIVRFLAVRDLDFLPWVDASRHALITAVTIQSGQFLQNYEPYLPIQQPIYHFGFHTIPASLQLMTNSYWPLEKVLLVTMQTLSSLMPLAVYSGTRLLTKHRGAAWLAAFLVALPFFFPAYYTTWGRLTQITGGLIMATLIGLTWQIGRGLNRRRLWPLVGLLAAGLFLVHFRVFSFYIPLVIWVFLISIFYKRPRPLLMAGILGGILVLPRLIQLLQPRITPMLTNTNIPENYNNFPTGYLTTGWEQFFWVLTAVAIIFLIAQSLSKRVDNFAPLSLALWMGLLFLLTAGELVGLPILLPQTNLNSMYISLFVPEAMIIGAAVGQVWQLLSHRHWLVDVL
ncbi:MAG: hypothetical protein KDE51_03335, partial [Anaerolineales bacterium]|nr:hypothetical protein [Anaerolineales bacterium]